MRIVGFAGVTEIDCSTGAVTVNIVEPETAPTVALMLLVPAATPLASPPAVMVAVAGVPEVQVTDAVMFCVDESL